MGGKLYKFRLFCSLYWTSVQQGEPMTTDEPVLSPQTPAVTTEMALRKLESRDWWLWSVACIFLISLTAAIHTFTLQRPVNPRDSWWEDQQTAVYYIGLLVL